MSDDDDDPYYDNDNEDEGAPFFPKTRTNSQKESATERSMDQHAETAAPSAISMKLEAKNDNQLAKAVAAYNKLFLKSNKKYKSGYKPPKKSGNGVEFSFPSEEDAVSFFQGRAEEKGVFEVYETTHNKHQLVAYSNGDGYLYRPDKSIIKPGELFSGPKPTHAKSQNNTHETHQALINALDTDYKPKEVNQDSEENISDKNTTPSPLSTKPKPYED
ncbi:MAG: hypothetical protein K0U37_09655 [Gammaproteobacteria bacterium]|nr:hypothetical protein [Gammaproteobacteria bacterium]